jgi:hypothetical protein
MEQGKILSIITYIILGIVGIVVAFSVIGGLAPTVTDSANAMAYPSNCSTGLDMNGRAMTFNITDMNCYNMTSATDSNITPVYLAGFYTLPLQGLFTPSGVVVLMLMVALFIVLLIAAFKLMKKK